MIADARRSVDDTGPRPRRVLHVVNKVNDRGDGIANVCVDLVCEQHRTGTTVALASTRGGFVEMVESVGVTHYEVSFHWRRLRSLLASVSSLRMVIKEFHPDVIHAHTMRSAVTARIAGVGLRTPVVATVHNEYQRGVILMGAAHRVVGVSTAVSEAMNRRGISRRRIRTVPNGTVGSIRRTSPDSTLVLPEIAATAIVSVGAVSERKGADVLLAAFESLAADHPEAELYYVGNADWQELVARAADSPFAARIHFVGFHSQPQAYLAVATVFALPSRRDPFPLVLLEALEAGVPIVASDVDGIPEALDGGRAGLLVPPGMVDPLASALSGLLESSGERARLSAAARARSGAFSVSKMNVGYTAIYREIDRSRPSVTNGSLNRNLS